MARRRAGRGGRGLHTRHWGCPPTLAPTGAPELDQMPRGVLLLAAVACRATMDFDATLGYPGEGHRARNVTAQLAFWNALTLRESYAVRADGTLTARGDLGKLPMLLGALASRKGLRMWRRRTPPDGERH